MQRSVTAGKKPDGSPDRKYVYGYTVEELENNYAALKDSLNRGAYTNDEGTTVGQWAEKWLSVYKGDREYNTIMMYKYAAKSIGREIGHIRLRDIKQFQIKAYLNRLTAVGKHRTASIHRMALVQIFDAAVEDRLMPDNPARRIKLAKKPRPKNRQLYSAEKLALSHAALTPKQQVFLYMGMDSGMRLEEILAVTRQDIDLANNHISITKVIVHAPNQAVLKPIPKTNDSFRDAPIFPRLGLLLEEYLRSFSGNALFTKRDGGYMSKSAFRRMWEGIEAAILDSALLLGLDLQMAHITSHMLRHTFATTCYYAGVDIKQAQRWMGHADIKLLLEVYTHLEREGEALARQNFINFTANGVNEVSTPAIMVDVVRAEALASADHGVLH